MPKHENVIKIDKRDNDFQYFDVLKRNRKKRHKHRAFFVEGVRNITEALRADWEFEALIYAGGRRLSDWARQTISSSRASTVYELTEPLMAELSDKEDTSELLAIVKMKPDEHSRIRLGVNPLLVVVDRPSNRGNLGTLIRSCDAFACDGLIMTGHAVDLYHSETISASVGTVFSVPVLRLDSPQQVSQYVESLGAGYPDLQIVGTTVHTEQYLHRCDFSKPTVLLIGNETVGLSSNYREMCDSLVKIPMNGIASSLNVSCASAIALYEVKRQREFLTL